MATPETIGKADCLGCGERVAVAINSGGFAYMRCMDCGLEVRHHWATSSKRFIDKNVTLRAPEIPEPVPATKSGKKPEIPAPAEAIVIRKPNESLQEWMDRKNGKSKAVESA